MNDTAYYLHMTAGDELNGSAWGDRDAMLEAVRRYHRGADFGISEGTIMDAQGDKLIATFGTDEGALA
jgi:hypothetical protein